LKYDAPKIVMVSAGRRCGKRAAQIRFEEMHKLGPYRCAELAAKDMRVLLLCGQPRFPKFPGVVRWMNFAPSDDGRLLFRMAVTLAEPMGPKRLVEVMIEVAYPWDVIVAADLYQLSRRWVFETMVASAVGEVVQGMPARLAQLERDRMTSRELAVVEWQIGA
jgi:hypothetical protein